MTNTVKNSVYLQLNGFDFTQIYYLEVF